MVVDNRVGRENVKKGIIIQGLEDMHQKGTSSFYLSHDLVS